MPPRFKSREDIRKNYRELLAAHGDAPESTQQSKEGQLFRFEKLVEVGDLAGSTILDLGCGICHLYEFLRSRIGDTFTYSGIDITPEAIAFASSKFPDLDLLSCDIFETKIERQWDYVFINGLFNNRFEDQTQFMKDFLLRAFDLSAKALAFNFISTYHNFTSPEMSYYHPEDVFHFCISDLSRKCAIHHHYERCDTAVFVYR